MIPAVLMALGGLMLVASAIGGPDASGFKALIAGGVVLFVAGCVVQPLSKNGGMDCYTDWDGRSNSTVCD